MRRCCYLLLATCCLLLAGCQTDAQRSAQQAVGEYVRGDYVAAQKTLEPLAKLTNEDFVLNNLRLGSVALVNGQLDIAEAAFLRAYEVINSVGVNNGGRSLGAALVDEKIKIWKGEPFERAMANYYLGLIYYINGDYNNARAAFENALFKLKDEDKEGDDDKSEKRKQRSEDSNFAVAYVMLGRCYERLDRQDLASANFAKAVQMNPRLQYLAQPEAQQDSNVLLAVDFGFGPKKITRDDGAVVGFGPTPWQVGPIPQPEVVVDGQPYGMHGAEQPTVDLLALAQDRRWQSIDTIRTIKSVAGTGLMVAGGVEGVRGLYEGGSAQRRDLTTGAALFAAGALLKATSHADVRQWEMLPRSVFVLPLKLPPGTHDVTVTFGGLYGLQQTLRGLTVPEKGEPTYYVRMQRWGRGEREWVGR